MTITLANVAPRNIPAEFTARTEEEAKAFRVDVGKVPLCMLQPMFDRLFWEVERLKDDVDRLRNELMG